MADPFRRKRQWGNLAGPDPRKNAPAPAQQPPVPLTTLAGLATWKGPEIAADRNPAQANGEEETAVYNQVRVDSKLVQKAAVFAKLAYSMQNYENAGASHNLGIVEQRGGFGLESVEIGPYDGRVVNPQTQQRAGHHYSFVQSFSLPDPGRADFIDGRGASAAVLYREDHPGPANGHCNLVLSFRGTTFGGVSTRFFTANQDLFDDLNAVMAQCHLGGADCGYVHKGFYDRYMSIKHDVNRALVTSCRPDQPIDLLITGHSLGSALANLAALDIGWQSRLGGAPNPQFPNLRTLKLVTFAAPQVGDPTFANNLDDLLDARWNDPNAPTTHVRVVHVTPDHVGEDIVSGGDIFLKYDMLSRGGVWAQHAGGAVAIPCHAGARGCPDLRVRGSGFYKWDANQGRMVHKSPIAMLNTMLRFAPLHPINGIVCDMMKDVYINHHPVGWSVMGPYLSRTGTCPNAAAAHGAQQLDDAPLPQAEDDAAFASHVAAAADEADSFLPYTADGADAGDAGAAELELGSSELDLEPAESGYDAGGAEPGHEGGYAWADEPRAL